MEAPNRHIEGQKMKDILGSVTVTFYLSPKPEEPQNYRKNFCSYFTPQSLSRKLAPELTHNEFNKKRFKDLLRCL